jgi:general secretion pathway protein M
MAITMETANSSGGSAAAQKKKFNSGGLIALLLLLLALLLVVAAIAVPAILLHRYYDERLFTMNKKIASYDRANAQRTSLLEKREELRAQDSRKYYLKAATPALASAELQDAVKTIIEATVGQGQVQNTQLSAPKDDGLVRNVSANFILQTSMPNVRKIFYAIETAQPYLLIDNLTMRTTVGSGHKSNPGQEPMVLVQFDVAGMALVNAAATASASVSAAPAVAPAANAAPQGVGGVNTSGGNATAGSIAKPAVLPAPTPAPPPTTAPAPSNTGPQVVPNGKPIPSFVPKAGIGGKP